MLNVHYLSSADALLFRNADKGTVDYVNKERCCKLLTHSHGIRLLQTESYLH